VLMGEERDQRAESHQHWRCSLDRERIPLPLRLNPKMRSHGLKRRFQLPAHDKLAHNLHWISAELGTQACLGHFAPQGITNHDPTNGHDRHAACDTRRTLRTRVLSRVAPGCTSVG